MISLFSGSLCGNLFSWHCVLATLPPHSFFPPTPFSINANTVVPGTMPVVLFPESTVIVMSLNPHVVPAIVVFSHSLSDFGFHIITSSWFSLTFWAAFLYIGIKISLSIGFLPLRLSYLNFSVISLDDLILSCRSLLGLP